MYKPKDVVAASRYSTSWWRDARLDSYPELSPLRFEADKLIDLLLRVAGARAYCRIHESDEESRISALDELEKVIVDTLQEVANMLTVDPPDIPRRDRHERIRTAMGVFEMFKNVLYNEFHVPAISDGDLVLAEIEQTLASSRMGDSGPIGLVHEQ
jgi:hypothetical protein